MLSFKTLTALNAILASVLATPTPETQAVQVEWETYDVGNGTSIEKRTVGGIEICMDINWGGTCGYAVQPLNTCIHLDAPWYHSISAFGPDPGTRCTWYSDYNCQSVIATQVSNPGYGNLLNFCCNDQIGSFLCYT